MDGLEPAVFRYHTGHASHTHGWVPVVNYTDKVERQLEQCGQVLRNAMWITVERFIPFLNPFRLIGLPEDVFISEDVLLPLEPTLSQSLTRNVYKITFESVSSEDSHTLLFQVKN